jgi:molecular chaperone GrpE (heat shock protein)
MGVLKDLEKINYDNGFSGGYQKGYNDAKRDYEFQKNVDKLELKDLNQKYNNVKAQMLSMPSQDYVNELEEEVKELNELLLKFSRNFDECKKEKSKEKMKGKK